jgi:hypothetical protein
MELTRVTRGRPKVSHAWGSTCAFEGGKRVLASQAIGTGARTGVAVMCPMYLLLYLELIIL